MRCAHIISTLYVACVCLLHTGIILHNWEPIFEPKRQQNTEFCILIKKRFTIQNVKGKYFPHSPYDGRMRGLDTVIENLSSPTLQLWWYPS